MISLQALLGQSGVAEWSKDILGISSIHATVTGVLAVFSITVVVLLATLEESCSRFYPNNPNPRG